MHVSVCLFIHKYRDMRVCIYMCIQMKRGIIGRPRPLTTCYSFSCIPIEIFSFVVYNWRPIIPGMLAYASFLLSLFFLLIVFLCSICVEKKMEPKFEWAKKGERFFGTKTFGTERINLVSLIFSMASLLTNVSCEPRTSASCEKSALRFARTRQRGYVRLDQGQLFRRSLGCSLEGFLFLRILFCFVFDSFTRRKRKWLLKTAYSRECHSIFTSKFTMASKAPFFPARFSFFD